MDGAAARRRRPGTTGRRLTAPHLIAALTRSSGRSPWRRITRRADPAGRQYPRQVDDHDFLWTRPILWWQPVRDDPAKWPAINAARVFEDEFTVFPGTLTELIIAAMTYTHGIHLGDSAPGDPRHWDWPFWRPDAHPGASGR